MKKYSIYLFILAVAFLFLTACEDFVDVDPPITALTGETVFDEDVNALAALSGLYSTISSQGSFVNTLDRMAVYVGSYSDEFINYTVIPSFAQFGNNDLSPDNSLVGAYWRDLYQFIYSSNSIIEGISSSQTLTDSLASQWEGEARFIRAWSYFYLINLYGEVPIATSTDFEVNSVLPRFATTLVYGQIIDDLLDAQNLLSDDYPTSQRVRANKGAANALLARVYLYQENWEAAEREASKVIDDNRYSLEANLDNVFLNNSNEAIWQLEALRPFFGSQEGNTFILTRPPRSSGVSIRPDYLTSFEDGDIRESSWIGSISSSSETFFYPFKFKIDLDFSGAIPNENLTPLRLAEIYLIRAEARARQNNVSGAQEDINAVRTRAQLSATTASDQASLLATIELERKHELFAELGHRWFDLKRTGRATEVLQPIKPQWQDTDLLWPVPLQEFLNNPNLGQQNPGY